ncbi:LOW QUALITY PROTEIN: E3 ubiquitin-protein ligase ZNRF2 [Spheniscus humboldti]
MVAPQTREQRPRRGRQLSRIPAGGSPLSTLTHRVTRSPPPARPLPPPRRDPRLGSPPPGPDSHHPRAPRGRRRRRAPGSAGGGGTMGAKQSSPTAANGRTRAYSGGDLPSSSSSGGGGGANGTGGRSAGAGGRYAHLAAAPHAAPGGATAAGGAAAAAGGAAGSAPRSRSLGGATASGARAAQSAFNIPHSSGPYGSQDSVNSTPEEGGRERPAGGGGGSSGGPRLVIGSLPAHLSPHLFGGFKCPVCSKFVSSDEMDLHLVMCLTKPRITYNEDVLSKDAGECAICLEELQQGDTIARLPCLCIYHKGCIDEWFEVNRSCPEHPSD